jgi:acetyltransferase-like isoleucine patch superfamily enzyme
VDTGRESFGAVIGEKAQIGRGVLLAPGVRIWPDRRVAAGAKVQSDILGGD